MRTAIQKIERVVVAVNSLLFLAIGLCNGQAQAPPARSRGTPPAIAAALFEEKDRTRSLSTVDLSPLETARAGIRAFAAPGAAPPGNVEVVSGREGSEKRIYLLKMESRSEQAGELLELQRNLLRNQLMVLKVLGVIGKHQEVMGQRLSRTENFNRELLTGMRDTVRGVDMARNDIASTLAETTDISEMTDELTAAIEEMQKQLEDVETGISDLQDTTNEILGTVANIESGS